MATSPLAWLNSQGVSPAFFWEGTAEKICLGQHAISVHKERRALLKGAATGYLLPVYPRTKFMIV